MKMNLLVIKNDKWRPQWNFTSHLLGSVIIKTVKVNEDWQECGGKMNLWTHWGCKATQPLVKTACGFHKAFKAKTTARPSDLLLGTEPVEMKSVCARHTCSCVDYNVHSTISHNSHIWTQSKCLPLPVSCLWSWQQNPDRKSNLKGKEAYFSWQFQVIVQGSEEVKAGTSKS